MCSSDLEIVFHFPHYDKDELGPATAIVLGTQKLIHPYETNVPMLFDLSKDLGEQHDLAKERTSDVAALSQRMNDYLKSVGALMPTKNPNFDPAKAQPFEPKRGGKGGKGKGGPGGPMKPAAN